MNEVLAFDLGGGSLRLAIVAAEAGVTSLVRLPTRIHSAGGGAFEASPDEWWAAFCDGCERLRAQGADLSRVGAVVGCGYTRTQTPVRSDGAVVHPAITFQDSRGAGALAAFLSRASDDLPQRAPNLSPFHPVARLLWLKKNKPNVWARIDTVIEPKDYINYRLTGVVASDWISQAPLRSFFAAIDGDPKSQAALEFDLSLAPKAVEPFDVVGRVRRGLAGSTAALAGKPVMCGSIDTWASVLGSGGLDPGAGYCISGTSDVSGVITSTPQECPGLLTVRWGPEHWQLGGPSQGAASRLEWCVERFLPGAALFDAIEESLATRSAAPIFLPYLDGERTPFWDDRLRGAFFGLTSRQTPLDFLRSVAEGINFLNRAILTRAEKAAEMASSRVCFSGGLSNNPRLCQLKADILDRPVFVPKSPETGLAGAASLALAATPDFADIARRQMRGGAWYLPDPAHRERYEAQFEIFEEATTALRTTSHRIAALTARE